MEVVPPPPPKSPRQSPCNSPAKPQKGRPQQQQPAPPPARPWPYPALAVDQLSSVVCDLSDAKAALPAALKSVRGDKTDRPGAIRVGMLLHCPPPVCSALHDGSLNLPSLFLGACRFSPHCTPVLYLGLDPDLDLDPDPPLPSPCPSLCLPTARRDLDIDLSKILIQILQAPPFPHSLCLPTGRLLPQDPHRLGARGPRLLPRAGGCEGPARDLCHAVNPRQSAGCHHGVQGLPGGA